MRAQDAADLLAGKSAEQAGAPRWWELGALRHVLGPGAASGRALAHYFGPDPANPEVAFLVLDATQSQGGSFRDLKRSVAVLRPARAGNPAAIAVMDFAVPSQPSRPACWTFNALEEPDIREAAFHGLLSPEKGAPRVFGEAILPRAGNRVLATAGVDAEGGVSVRVTPRQAEEDSVFLNVIQLSPAGGATPAQVEPVVEIDLVGFRFGEWVVLFHPAGRSARSPLFFTTEGGERLRYLLTGLAPGTWEIWRNGWLEDPMGVVEGPEATLYFEGPPGMYFFRRLQ